MLNLFEMHKGVKNALRSATLLNECKILLDKIKEDPSSPNALIWRMAIAEKYAEAKRINEQIQQQINDNI